MKFRINLQIDIEIDPIDLRTAALGAVGEMGGVRTVDGLEDPVVTDLAAVDDPRHAMYVVLSADLANALHPRLPVDVVKRFSPTVTVVPD